MIPPPAWTAEERAHAASIRLAYPRIVYTDLNGLWLLAEWHEVKI
jgi:hypothetical protein